MVERMTLGEIVRRRARDYGVKSAAELADLTGLSFQKCWALLRDRRVAGGIKTRRALVKALDLAPKVIERSVRR